MSTQIGIGHLTLLALTPPELVAVAAQAGYDFVGLRVRPATAGEQRYPMEPGSPMSRAAPSFSVSAATSSAS